MPPRRTKSRSTSSEEEYDVEKAAVNIQLKLQKLRKDRDDQFNAIIHDFGIAIDDLRARMASHGREQRRQAIQSRSRHLNTVIKNLERRQKIEAEMAELIGKVHRSMREVEALVLEACGGRKRDMLNVINIMNAAAAS